MTPAKRTALIRALNSTDHIVVATGYESDGTYYEYTRGDIADALSSEGAQDGTGSETPPQAAASAFGVSRDDIIDAIYPFEYALAEEEHPGDVDGPAVHEVCEQMADAVLKLFNPAIAEHGLNRVCDAALDAMGSAFGIPALGSPYEIATWGVRFGWRARRERLVFTPVDVGDVEFASIQLRGSDVGARLARLAAKMDASNVSP